MLERVWKKRERTTLTPTVGRNINCCSHYGEWYGGSLENRAINRATIWSSNPINAHISGENHNSKRYMHPKIHCSTIYNSQDMETA